MKRIFLLLPEKRILIILTVLFFSLFLSLLFIFPDGYGGADGFLHYMISRYAWKHPLLFLDHWGKPVFTLLSSSFSQLGYKYTMLFNVLATFSSSWLAFKISKKLREEYPALSALFFVLMPMVVLTSISALTEPLFGLVLILSVWLFSEKKYFLSISLLSFLPLVRTEGFVVFPVFVFALMLTGKWKYSPLVLFGALLYSIVGYFAVDDFFWLITKSPYKMEAGIYGSGPWYHFIKNSWYIFGTPLTILIVIGSWFYFPRSIKWLKDEKNILKIVIAGSFAAYFVSHSYAWWKGTGGSLGLERVIAGVCPLATIIALTGCNFINKYIQKAIVSPIWIQSLFFIAVFKSCFGVAYGNLQQGVEQKLMSKAAEWIKETPDLADQKFYYYNPHIAFLLNRDIYDRNQVEQLWGLINENDPLLWLQDGQFLVWDAHFGNNEGKTQLDKLLHKSNVRIVKRFYPDEQTNVLGNYPYEIFILVKQSGWKDDLSEVIPFQGSKFAQLSTIDFSISKEDEFVEVFDEDITAYSKSKIVYADIVISFPAEKKTAKENLFLVFEMKCDNRPVKYEAIDLSLAEEEGPHMILKKHYLLPPLRKECSRTKAYFWNKSKIDMQGIKIELKLSDVPSEIDPEL